MNVGEPFDIDRFLLLLILYEGDRERTFAALRRAQRRGTTPPEGDGGPIPYDGESHYLTYDSDAGDDQ